MSTYAGPRNLARNPIIQRQKSLKSHNTKRLFNIHTTSWFRGLTVMTADSDSASEGSTPSETFLLLLKLKELDFAADTIFYEPGSGGFLRCHIQDLIKQVYI
uniref:WGS project CBMC000000000 data, contig CS3220_c000872 n=1 Tax=Fusarium pseudograminearum CS3220 TaxID=1318456 RepID=A0A096PC89_FUSPS|nr:unnamed protein product [Fusarium pseudograminearum CS3220]